MKKVTVSISLLVLLLITPSYSFAQTQVEVPEDLIQIGENEALVSFKELGYDDESLISPYDATSVRFGTPPDWQLLPGDYIDLNYDVLFSGTDTQILTENIAYSGILNIVFNGHIIENIYLEGSGSYSQRIQIPAIALSPKKAGARNELEILLDAGFSCFNDVRTTVIIKSTSTFFLLFNSIPPELNLSLLPYPFFARNSLLPEKTLLVVPDNPEAGELEAAFNIAAGFGSITDRNFDFSLLPVGQLNETTMQDSNMIFIGKPAHFNLLSSVQFPLQIANDKFVNLPTEASEDGIIQLAHSPWGKNKTIMLVSGSSTEAVIKGAKAVSTGNLFTNIDPQLVYVASINPFVENVSSVEDFTVNDLGYTAETLTGIGVSSIDFSFFASKEQLSTEDAYFDLFFTHSNILDDASSSISIKLNNVTIASENFTGEEENLSSQHIIFPAGLLRFGENILNVRVKLLPHTSCDSADSSGYWVTVLDNSSFHIPVEPFAGFIEPSSFDLQLYPNMFLKQSNLGNITFILPNSAPTSWQIASEIAFDFGKEANPIISELTAAFGNAIPENLLNDQALIFVGLPNELETLSEINQMLPAPFDFDKNTASERLLQVSYRIPPEVALGFLELTPSPFNSTNPLLVVAGNSNLGVSYAGSALTSEELKDQLAGVFIIVSEEQIINSAITSQAALDFGQQSNRLIAGADLEPILNPSAQVLSFGQSSQENPSWLFPVMIGSAIFIILIFGYVMISSQRKKLPSLEHKPQDNISSQEDN